MKPKKIALVANTTWNIYNFRLNIIEKLLSEGHEVVVMAPVDEFIHYKEKFGNLRHVPIRRLDRDSINPIKDARLTLEFIKLYRRERPDLIIHYTVKPNIYGGFAARYLRIPSFAVVTGLGYAFIHNGFIKRTTKLLYKWSSPWHRKVIFENEDDKELFISDRLIKSSQGIAVKGCGVDTRFYTKAGMNGKPDRPIFTFIGRLLYDKGVREFIEAAHILREKNIQAEFWLVGEIDKENPSAIREDDLVRWIKDVNIKYHGSTHNVRDYFNRSDCIVLPSYREGMSRVIMEAMSMERPVITTDTAGCRETVDNGVSGFLVPVRNAAALADAMERFLKLSESQRLQMGAHGREKATREFDDKIIADTIYSIVQTAMADT